ncbi:hypothetical protein, partial [Glaciibacter psychrotolerans]
MEKLTDRLRESAAAVARLGDGVAAFHGLSDAELLGAQGLIATLRRQVDSYAVWAAGEIALRSKPEFGQRGLARRHGFGSPESMIERTAGTTHADAVKLVSLGVMLADTADAAEAAVAAAAAAAADADAAAAAATDAEDAAAESGDASHADDPGAVDAEAGPPPGAPSALSW